MDAELERAKANALRVQRERIEKKETEDNLFMLINRVEKAESDKARLQAELQRTKEENTRLNRELDL